MAIRIPILTSFDPKGLKQANAQFGKLQSSIGSLGRNFAAAGAVIAGAGALIGRSVVDAAESQKVFAQTEAVLKSMGTTANGTAQDISNLASALQKSTAFSDEAILAGQNLLLTFKNIQNQAGAGNDIFDQTSTLMLDVARAMGTTASGEAIRLGKALNDPVKGISALTRVGIQFTDQQKEQIKALAESGDLMGAQKIILAELQQQFGGSAAAYAGTFSGQLEGLNNDLNDLSEEIGFMVMPALQGMMAEFRDLIPIIGPQLKAAIESVDWKALTESVVGFTKFLIENATTIANVVIAIFTLNTAFKLMQVAIGISNVAIALKTWYMAQLATGMTTATIATNLFSSALKLIPWVGAVAGIGAVIGEYVRLKTAIDNSNTSLSKFNTETIAVTGGVAKLNPISTAWQRITLAILGAITAQKQFNNQPVSKPGRTSVLDDYAYNLKTGQTTPGKTVANEFTAMANPSSGASKAAKKAGESNGKTYADQIKAATAQVAESIKQLVADFKESTPILDEWKEFGLELGNTLVGGLQQAYKDGLNRTFGTAAKNLMSQLKPTYNKIAALQNRLVERTKFERSMKEDIMGLFNFAEAEKGIESIIQKFRDQVKATKDFRNNLVELTKLGLSSDLVKQIAETRDFTAAAELIKGGEDAISEINNLYTELDAFSSQIAVFSGNQLFNLGIDSATGYIRTLEDAMATLQEFSKLQNQQAPAGAEVSYLQGRLMDYMPSPADPRTKKELKADLKSLQGWFDTWNNQNLRNVKGLRESVNTDFAALNNSLQDPYAISDRNTAMGAGNFTINVSGGMATSSEIGRAVVQAISSYERGSGAVFARA